MIVSLSSCQNTDLPKNPVLSFPITTLVLEVSGEDYTAVPVLNENHNFTGDLSLLVKVPSERAIVKDLSIQNGYQSNISIGDEVLFSNDILEVLIKNGSNSESYRVKMEFNPPPIIYAVKTSDHDEEGSSYYLDINTQDFIASGSYDNIYEGELNLTNTNWDNVGLVSEDLTTIYNLAAGPWPPESHYVWIAETKPATSSTHFRMEGPWNDWKATNDNPAIISPGVWHVIFDISTRTVDMTMTQWAINGSSVTSITAMNYDSMTRCWNVILDLNPGDLYFETIPVVFGDPVYRLSYKANILGMLAADGENIRIEKAGKYNVELKLSNPPYYIYSITPK